MSKAFYIADLILDILIIAVVVSLLVGCSSPQRYRTRSTFTIEVQDQKNHKGWSKTWEKEQTDE